RILEFDIKNFTDVPHELIFHVASNGVDPADRDTVQRHQSVFSLLGRASNDELSAIGHHLAGKLGLAQPYLESPLRRRKGKAGDVGYIVVEEREGGAKSHYKISGEIRLSLPEPPQVFPCHALRLACDEGERGIQKKRAIFPVDAVEPQRQLLRKAFEQRLAKAGIDACQSAPDIERPE